MTSFGSTDPRSRSVEVLTDFERALPGIRKSGSPPDQIAYARDLWPRHHLDVRAGRIAEHRPAIVAWPKDTEEVAKVVRWCASEGVPIAPFGAGSGVCGGILPDQRTVVLDLKRLDRWRKLDGAMPSLDVEAGVLGIRLEEELEEKGYTLGHFPSSILCSTVGGWVAARSAGQCSGRYGKIEDMVANLEVVTGKGEIVNVSRRTHGPDLTPLIIGSEGTLGIVTSATLRLHPAPGARAFGAFSFNSIEEGWDALRRMFQAGLRPSVARLYDPFDSFIARMGRRHSIREDDHATEKKRKAPGAGASALRTILRTPRALNEVVEALGARVLRGSTLVLIFDGARAEPAEDLGRAAKIAERVGAKDLGEEPARHWLAHRYAVSYRQAPVFMSGSFSDTMEVAASWSKLGGLYKDVRAALGKHVFVMAHLSHAYPDGCSIYFTFAGSAKDDDQALAKYDAAWQAALDAAIGAGGTLSHHHGVGRSKAPRLGAELGLGVDIVRSLRNELDPSGILNPGNLLPRQGDKTPRPPIATPPEYPIVDATSCLVRASGTTTLGEISRALAAHEMRLALGEGTPPLDTRVGTWIANGARGAPDPWLDPADHLVAGFTARLASGAELAVRAAPRRAVGPDLFALFLGARERCGVITSVDLRAHVHENARHLPTHLPRNPPLGPEEAALFGQVLGAASRVR